MNFAKRLVCVLLCAACLTMVLPVSAGAAEDVTYYAQRMIRYYLHYQDGADTEIETMLDQITAADPAQGNLWRQIMEDWQWANEDMTISPDVLPDGLPQDDSLCIVILGYGLRSDGSMKEELVDRLVVGLASALKYPNAYVCVTGGPTASGTNDTEAGQMAAWLREKGLEEDRIIVEPRSLSTHENAIRVFDILLSQYPQVNSVAVVSSDYHIPWGVSMFMTMANQTAYESGKIIQVVGNAANITGSNTDTLYSQAIGISVITDTPFDAGGVPAQYATQPSAETVPPATSSPEIVEDAVSSPPAAAAVLLGLAAVILLIPTKKRRKNK